MDFGRIPEHIYERSVYKVIHTTEYRNKTLDGAGLGADCAILQIGGGIFATTQGQAYGADAEVGVRALLHGLNRFAAAGILQPGTNGVIQGAEITTQITIVMPHYDAGYKGENFGEPFLREIVRRISESAKTYGVLIIGVESSVIPDLKSPFVSMQINAWLGQDTVSFGNHACANQDVVMTKWLGLEGTALIASLKEQELQTRYPLGMIEDAAAFNRFLSIIPEAATAVQSGVSAMHAVREGGIFGGLWQLAQKNDVGLVIDLKKIPVKQETIEICEFYDVNPYELLSGGSLLMTTDSGTRLVSVLEKQKIEAAVIGRTTDENARILVNDEEKRFLEPARHDSLYQVLTK